MHASTHCHQWPSISPSTRLYFFGTLISLFNESGSKIGLRPPQPQAAFPFVPTNKVLPSKSPTFGQSPKMLFMLSACSSSFGRSGVMPPSIQYKSRSFPPFCLNLKRMLQDTGPLNGKSASEKIPSYTVLALPDTSLG